MSTPTPHSHRVEREREKLKKAEEEEEEDEWILMVCRSLYFLFLCLFWRKTATKYCSIVFHSQEREVEKWTIHNLFSDY